MIVRFDKTGGVRYTPQAVENDTECGDALPPTEQSRCGHQPSGWCFCFASDGTHRSAGHDLTAPPKRGRLSGLSARHTNASALQHSGVLLPLGAPMHHAGFLSPARTFPTDGCCGFRSSKSNGGAHAHHQPSATPRGLVPGEPTDIPCLSSSASLILAQDERWRRA